MEKRLLKSQVIQWLEEEKDFWDQESNALGNVGNFKEASRVSHFSEKFDAMIEFLNEY
jgi:hypothetical protein